jgi:hypothetical protein
MNKGRPSTFIRGDKPATKKSFVCIIAPPEGKWTIKCTYPFRIVDDFPEKYIAITDDKGVEHRFKNSLPYFSAGMVKKAPRGLTSIDIDKLV